MATHKSTKPRRPQPSIDDLTRLCELRFRYGRQSRAEAAAKHFRKEARYCLLCDGWHLH